MSRTAFIALGTNVGNNLSTNMDQALLLLRKNGAVERLLNTSSLYQSKPTEFGSIVSTQREYLNCVVKIQTTLDPLSLLRAMKQVEKEMGRNLTTGKRHGPRVIDLDLLMFDDRTSSYNNAFKDSIRMDTEELTLPHPRMLERDFVMRPLYEILPNSSLLPHSSIQTTILGVLASYGPNLEWIRTQGVCKKVAIMNATPDSFSDGGTLQDPLQRALQLKTLGADALDVGGESTRPGALPLSAQDEILRIKPVLECVSGCFSSISVDTYKAKVAEQALKWGASVVNDVTGGRDSNMFPLVADRPGTSLVLMHSKGNSQTMDSLSNTYSHADIVDDVAKDLSIKVQSAIEAGIPRWRLIVDPGIGFAKRHEDSFRLLTSSNLLRDKLGGNMLVMIGHSRKRFLKPSFLGMDVKQEWPSVAVREEINARATDMAIEGGADMVRIHY